MGVDDMTEWRRGLRGGLGQLVGGEIPGGRGRAFLAAVVLLRGDLPLDLGEVQRQGLDRFATRPPDTLTLLSTTLLSV